MIYTLHIQWSHGNARGIWCIYTSPQVVARHKTHEPCPISVYLPENTPAYIWWFIVILYTTYVTMEMPGIYSICIPGSHTRKGADRAILREESWWRNTEENIAHFPGKYRYFRGNWTTASLLAGYTANYTAGCQSFSLPRSSGHTRGSWRPKHSSLDTASSRHKASLCAGILCNCRLSHGKPVS